MLELIREEFGFQNTVDEVFFTAAHEATLFVRASDGTSPLMANLTNLAAWRAGGSIASDDELKSKWLRIF